MSIANYTTTISPEKTAGQIMSMLAQQGSSNISIEYADGAPAGMSFAIETEYGLRGFKLPIRSQGVLNAMSKDKSISRSQCTRTQASRVAWRIARDWLRSQLALIDAGLAALDEIMMPWMLNDSDTTMYELFQASQLEITKEAEQ
jgi:hypothetical protein